MVTTNDILNFASTHKVFSRKELIANLRIHHQLGASSSTSEQIDRLLKSGQLIRLKRGVDKLSVDARKDFSVSCSEEIKKINNQIKSQFPFINYCIWSGTELMPYMHHIPNLNLLFVDVEREVTESVFNLLNSNSNQRVFLMPTPTEHDRYINTNEAIIIRPLISESPLQIVEGVNTPAIEKILVDIVGDAEFSFLQGFEINYVYTAIFESYHVNKNKLFRYATRREGKKK